MKHTKGPWKYSLAVVSNAPSVFVITNGEYGAPNLAVLSQENEANARLMSTAPELLQELKSALLYIKTYGGEVTENFCCGGNLEAVEAIIKKAEGKE